MTLMIRFGLIILLMLAGGGCSLLFDPTEKKQSDHTLSSRHESSDIQQSQKSTNEERHGKIPAVIDGIREHDYFPATDLVEPLVPSSVLVLWDQFDESYDKVYLSISESEAGSSRVLELTPNEIEEVEHPSLGLLHGYRIAEINPFSDLYISIQTEKNGIRSEPSAVIHLSPKQNSIETSQELND